MAYLIGGLLALAVGGGASLFGLDRDRVFYPTILIVVPSYYALFAVMGGSSRTLAVEVTVVAVFVAASITGFKYSLWLVATGLAMHGVFDIFHNLLIVNPGAPVWWPRFCSTYDVVAAGYLACLLLRGRLAANAR